MALFFVVFLCPKNGFGEAVTGVSVSQAMDWAACLAAAADYHPDLVVARESVAQAVADVNIAQSNRLPTVGASASVVESHVQGKNTKSSSVGVNSSWKVFDGGALRSASEGAKAQVQSRRQAYRVSSARLRYDLRAAYIGLWKAQRSVAIAEAIVEIRQKSHDLISLRYRSGIEHLGALKSAQAKLSIAKANLSAAMRDVATAQSALCKAIGYPMTKPLAVAENIDLPQKLAEGEIPDFEALAKSHPSYTQSLAAERVAQSGVESSRAGYWPSVVVSANLERASQSLPPKDNSAAMSLGVNYTLFDGLGRSAALQKSRSALRGAQAGTRSTYDALYNSLVGAWSTLQTSIDTAMVQKEFLEADTEREKIAAEQYNVGLTTYDSWTIIEDNLVSTQNAYLDARASALNAAASWELAKGSVLEEEVGNDSVSMKGEREGEEKL